MPGCPLPRSGSPKVAAPDLTEAPAPRAPGARVPSAWIAFSAILAVSLLARSYALTRLPIFIDESLHLFWSWRLRQELGFLRPLRDGKPMQALVTAVTTAGASDPLWAGRLTSVAVGAVGMWAAWQLGRRLFDEKTGLAAAFLYAVCPFTFFYDRLVLADIYLSTFAALTVLASLLAVQDPRKATAIRLGLALAGCVLAKVPGLVMAPIPIVAALLVRPARPGVVRHLILAYAVAAVLVAYPLWYFFEHSSQVRKGAGMEEEIEPLGLVAENVGTAASWLWIYWTAPIGAAGLAALLAGIVRWRAPELLLGAASLGPVAAFTALSFYWYPRYILFATVPFLVLAARGLIQAADLAARPLGRSSLVAAVVTLAASLPALFVDSDLLLDPPRAAIPAVEHFQYIEGFSSGYGADEVALRLRASLREHPAGLTVAADRSGRRTIFLALRTCFMHEPRVEVLAVSLGAPEARALLLERAAKQPTFVVIADKTSTEERVRGLPAVRIATLRKPGGTLAGELYQIQPKGAP